MDTLTTSAHDILEEISSMNREFEKRFADGDANGMGALYTRNGSLLPPGADEQQGTAAIGGFWQMVMNMGIKSARLKTVEVEQLEDTAIELGHYELGAANGDTLDNGKYVVIWKRVDGNWKLDKDIWNTSRG